MRIPPLVLLVLGASQIASAQTPVPPDAEIRRILVDRVDGQRQRVGIASARSSPRDGAS